MRFLFVASGRLTPSTRFRIEQYFPALRAAGHRCDIAYSFPPKYDYFPWLGWRPSQRLKRGVRQWHALKASLRRYDTIVIEREVFDDDTWDLEARFREATKRLVLDVDDAVFLRHETKFDKIAEMCDVAIAGNRYLAEYLQPRCPRVVQIPTCIRMTDYPQRQMPARGAVPVVGWMGTTHNVDFLSEAAAALRRVAREHRFRLLVVSASEERLARIDLEGVEVEFRTWTPQRMTADLQEMDIGLMPLPQDQDWMKYKCGFKLLQYMAVGTPGIATPIGVNAEILAGETTGRAASNESQWQAALEELLIQPELRHQLGTAGRELVQQHYSIEQNWRLFEQVLVGESTMSGF